MALCGTLTIRLLPVPFSFYFPLIYHFTLEHLPAPDGSGFAIRQVSGIPGRELRQVEIVRCARVYSAFQLVSSLGLTKFDFSGPLVLHMRLVAT